MWLLSFAIYCGCKWLTWRRSAVRGRPLWLHLGYLFAWPGMDAAAFLCKDGRQSVEKPEPFEWLAAGLKTVAGAAILFGLARFVPSDRPYAVGWVGMVGIVLVLHFGSFHLLSCFWRSLGVDARPLMNRPLASTSLSEFWGKRWNTAFRDLTHRFLFRPLTSRLGPRRAILVGFVASGVVHDAVISLPAGGGFGGPTLFFLLQGIGMFVERSRAGRSVGLGRGWRGWLFAIILLVAPVGMLFHPPFVVGVVVPFLQVIGAV